MVANGEGELHDEPDEHGAYEHVDDGQRDIHKSGEFHDEPPYSSEDQTILLPRSF